MRRNLALYVDDYALATGAHNQKTTAKLANLNITKFHCEEYSEITLQTALADNQIISSEMTTNLAT